MNTEKTNLPLTWEKDWATLFSQALNEQEYQLMAAVKQSLEAGELALSDDLSSLSKQKVTGLYQQLIKRRRPALQQRITNQMPAYYHVINSEVAFKRLLTLLSQEPLFVIDTPFMDGAHVTTSELIGLSFYLPHARRCFYIPLRHETTEPQLSDVLVFEGLKEILESEQAHKIGFNLKVLLRLLRHEQIQMKGFDFDVFIAAHLLNENEESYELEALATRYQKFLDLPQAVLGYKELFGLDSFETTSLTLATFYACQRVEIIFAYTKFIERQFERIPSLRKVYNTIEHPLIEVCADMEEAGLFVDLAYTQSLIQQLEEELLTLSDQLKPYLGDINPESSAQLKNFYYNVIKLPDPKNTQKTDADTLKQYKSHHPSIEILLAYRDVSTLLKRVKGLQPLVSANQRLHGSFHQCGAKTGRFSSSDPNLQSLQAGARKMFIAPTGKMLVSIDYSQIEPRLLSHITQDPTFMQSYIEGRDLYSEIASKTFNLPLSECGDQSKWRKMAKTGLLATMYGSDAYNLSVLLESSVEEAEHFIRSFFNSYPVMKKWATDIELFVDEQGYTETMWGRKRRFPGHPTVAHDYKMLHQSREEKSISYDVKQRYADLKRGYQKVRRQSVNSIIQGSAADLMKLALIDLHRFLKTKGPEWKILAAIHDEVLFEIPASATREELEELARIQREAVKLSVPMKVDIEIFQRWGCGMSVDEWFARQDNPMSLHHTFAH